MEPVADGFSVVVAGAWNPAIFTPAWVGGGRLTAAQEIEVALDINNPALSPRLKFDGIFLRILPDRLVLWPREVSDELLTRMQRIGGKILTELPHTPVQALGVNFRFIESNPSGRLLDVFTLSDTAHLVEAGAVVKATEIRRLILIDDRTLNLTLTLSEGAEVVVDLNFHWDVQAARDARLHLDEEGGVLRLHSNALDILRTSYGIEPLEEGE